MEKIELTEEQRKQIFLEEQEKMKAVERQKEDDRKEYKKLVDETTRGIYGLLVVNAEKLKATKKTVVDNYMQLVEIKKNIYENKDIDGQTSHTFTAEDGSISVQIGQNQLDGWDDTVSEGVAKVRHFIEGLAHDENSKKLVGAILKLLSKDKAGNLRVKNLYQLEELAEQYGSEEFKDGVAIIRKSYKPTESSIWIKAWSKDEQGNKVHVPVGLTDAVS